MRMPQESGSSNAGVGDAVRRWFGRRRPRRLKPAIRDAAGDAGRDAMRPAAVLGRPSPGGVGLRPDGHRADHDADIRVSSRFRTSGEFEYECLRPTANRIAVFELRRREEQVERLLVGRVDDIAVAVW